ncbi:MAG: SpoIIE family protein phosphatase, partial [Clostridia bacterium]|nr:SpoIIE family protein phosphatase [Clostridia bacterium]
TLCDSVKQMERDINTYITDLTAVTAEKERIGAELNVATQIQADMLPRIFPPFPDRKEFDLFASMHPAKEVGGDFYDFFLVDDDHIALVMADVSGKGVPAALFMVIAKTLIKNRAQLGESPAEVLNSVNEQLCEGNEAELFVTVWLAIIEISTGRGIAANAGHEHPVIRRADGKFELVVYRHSPAVATMEGMRFKEHPFELNPGDRLFVYTDGVPEATNSANELFGPERMLEALNKDPNASSKQLVKNVQAGIDGFVKDAPQFDDITMLSFDYFGAKDGKEITLDATDENLATVLAFVEKELEPLDCPSKTLMQIEVAVEEIFVNVAHYAYKPDTGKVRVCIKTTKDPKSISITFVDHGIPYDPLAKPDPDITLASEDRQIGGLGIFMVKKSMDDMKYEYRDSQNVLTLFKKID